MSVTYRKFSKLPYKARVPGRVQANLTDRFLDQFSTRNRMVPFSGTALCGILRVFDMRAALGVTSAAHRVAEWPCRIGDVGGHRMRTGSKLESSMRATNLSADLIG